MAAPRDREERGEGEERDLDRKETGRGRPDLPGDMEENRNLSGSSTWETLEEDAGNREVGREED